MTYIAKVVNRQDVELRLCNLITYRIKINMNNCASEITSFRLNYVDQRHRFVAVTSVGKDNLPSVI